MRKSLLDVRVISRAANSGVSGEAAMSNRSRPRVHLEKRNQTDGTSILGKAAPSRQLPRGRVSLVNQSQFGLFSFALRMRLLPLCLAKQCTCCIRRATPRTPERPRPAPFAQMGRRTCGNAHHGNPRERTFPVTFIVPSHSAHEPHAFRTPWPYIVLAFQKADAMNGGI